MFLYTYLYNVHVGSQDSRTEELYGTGRRVPDAREINDKAQVDNKPPHIDVDKPPEIESQLVNYRDVHEIKSKAEKPHDGDDSRSEIPNKLQDKLQDDNSKVTSNENDAKLDKLKTTDKMITDPIIRIREQVNEINEKEVIINDDKFLTFDLVMIIQVHRRTEYLKMLLESLRNARDISKVLLVVSFDYYDDELFSVVEKVDFCKVMMSYIHHHWVILYIIITSHYVSSLPFHHIIITSYYICHCYIILHYVIILIIVLYMVHHS